MTGKEVQVIIKKEGGEVVSTADTFSENIIQQYIFEADVAPNTALTYRKAAKDFLAFLNKNNAELTEAALVDYREFLKATRSNGGAKLYFGRAKKFVAWLAARGYIARDCGLMVKGIKLDTLQHSRDALTLDETVETLAKMNGNSAIEIRNRCIFICLITLGVRTCELAAADCGDIQRRRGQWLLSIKGKGRTAKSESVIVPDEVKAVIDQYLATRGKVKSSDPLFVSTSRRNNNQRLQTQTFSRVVKQALRNAHFDSPRLSAHSLRHGNAVISLENPALDKDGKEVKITTEEISRNLRHRDLKTSQTYIWDAKIFDNPCNRTVTRLIFEHLEGVAA